MFLRLERFPNKDKNSNKSWDGPYGLRGRASEREGSLKRIDEMNRSHIAQLGHGDLPH